MSEVASEGAVGLSSSQPPAVRRIPWLAIGLASVLILTAVAVEILPLPEPNKVDLRVQLLPPIGFDGSEAAHVLGTDELGRDLLSRVAYGARTSLVIAGGSILLGGTIGVLLGLAAGFRGGWVDASLMRLVDATLAFPVLLLALVTATVLGAGVLMVIAVLSVAVSVRYGRLVRGEVLSAREQEYVLSARLAGASGTRIAFRHVMPNIVGPIVVFATLQVGWAVLMESSLSFFGAGVPPDIPAWGSMIAEGRSVLRTAWWVSVVPGVAISITVLAFNSLGDWLRDVWDPHAD